MNIDLTHEELFLIEMALDEVICKLDMNSKLSDRFNAIDQKIYSLRKSSESSVPDTELKEVPPDSTPIEDLDFCVRTYNGLKRAHIDTVGQLAKCNKATISNIHNFGKTSIKEVRDALISYGFTPKF